MYENDHKNIIGLLIVKKLIKLDPEDNTPVRELEGASIPPPSCSANTPLFDVLNQFQTGKSNRWMDG